MMGNMKKTICLWLSAYGLSACQKSIFDTCNENLRIFIAKEKHCGNLKISRFSGRMAHCQNFNFANAVCFADLQTFRFATSSWLEVLFFRRLRSGKIQTRRTRRRVCFFLLFCDAFSTVWIHCLRSGFFMLICPRGNRACPTRQAPGFPACCAGW